MKFLNDIGDIYVYIELLRRFRAFWISEVHN
jgi:hypothetical protein